MSSIGILIGFYGYLFPGNINLMVVNIYATKRCKLLWLMLFLIMLFESIYCTASLYFLSTLQASLKLYKVIEIVSFILVLIMGLWMVFERKKEAASTHKNTVYRGVFSMIIHPQQIPFWIVVGVFISPFLRYNMDIGKLLPFVGFNAIGTVLAMLFYMIFGNKLLIYFKLNITQINKVMGGFYVLLALYNLLMLVR
jgi:putative Ca2+/H+ antiporter (TMEM165/GDT1 family)